MIAHLVGGPKHGAEYTVSGHPERILRTVELRTRPMSVSELPVAVLSDPDWTEHEYRLLHTDGRYAVYRWLAPKVEATFSFSFKPPRPDIADLYYETQHLTKDGEAVKVKGANCDGETVEVHGVVLVDGPPDAKAAEDAAAAVRALIERELRGYALHSFAVSVDG